MSSAELNEEDRAKERYDPLLASNANDHYGGTQTVTRKQNTKYNYLQLVLFILLIGSIITFTIITLNSDSKNDPSSNNDDNCPSIASLSADKCNFGPTHHSHLVLPINVDRDRCKLKYSLFFLSHGATFFCPHMYDVKLLAQIEEDDARELLCDTHFDALEKKVSSKVALRPTLPAGGLVALARGQIKKWKSPVMYWIHNFGKDNDSGPGNGWNLTTVRANEITTVNILKVLYSAKLEIQPRPSALTYLAHHPVAPLFMNNEKKDLKDLMRRHDYGKDTIIPYNAILSHFISTSGRSGFDHILKVLITNSTTSKPLDPSLLRSTWATFISIPLLEDAYAERLKIGGKSYAGVLHVYNPKNGLPIDVKITIKVILDYYHGTSDGFAGFGTMCPYKKPYPQSPSTCGM